MPLPARSDVIRAASQAPSRSGIETVEAGGVEPEPEGLLRRDSEVGRGDHPELPAGVDGPGPDVEELLAPSGSTTSTMP